ncbi:MAG: fructosamine kinase family protein [Bacteroidetes bacterium]|nr:fructosamine kinase family protein [Bacteroidota bacterium]
MQPGQATKAIIEGVTGRIINILPVSGGSINNAFKVETASSAYFLKTNPACLYLNMFETEAKGLRLLKNSSLFKVPDVVLLGNGADKFILMEWIETGQKTPVLYKKAGEYLAQMHHNSGDFFGLSHHNYIGSLPQSNKAHQNWGEFFKAERLEPQLKIACKKNIFEPAVLKQFEKLFTKLNEIFPNEPPALLHGDLWSGNFMATIEGSPAIFDPAVYFGHREMDLAMTKLFGGFSPEFYQHYQETFPLEKGWQKRMDICNLYPLLVHVNLFGGSYVNQVREVLEGF